MYLLLGAIPIIRCSRGTAAEMVAVVRNDFLKQHCCCKFLPNILFAFFIATQRCSGIVSFS